MVKEIFDYASSMTIFVHSSLEIDYDSFQYYLFLSDEHLLCLIAESHIFSKKAVFKTLSKC